MGLHLANLHFSFQVSEEKKKGTNTGWLYDGECSSRCPDLCTNWKVYNGVEWEEDTTLTIKCKGY